METAVDFRTLRYKHIKSQSKNSHRTWSMKLWFVYHPICVIYSSIVKVYKMFWEKQMFDIDFVSSIGDQTLF